MVRDAACSDALHVIKRSSVGKRPSEGSDQRHISHGLPVVSHSHVRKVCDLFEAYAHVRIYVVFCFWSLAIMQKCQFASWVN